MVSGGATGTGDLNGTTTVSNLVATDKAFRVGQTVTSSDGGIPAGTTITRRHHRPRRDPDPLPAGDDDQRRR